MTSVGSKFLYGRLHGANPSPVHMRPHESDPFTPHVDVINGWPLTCESVLEFERLVFSPSPSPNNKQHNNFQAEKFTRSPITVNISRKNLENRLHRSPAHI